MPNSTALSSVPVNRVMWTLSSLWYRKEQLSTCRIKKDEPLSTGLLLVGIATSVQFWFKMAAWSTSLTSLDVPHSTVLATEAMPSVLAYCSSWELMAMHMTRKE
jgi:uncharacterized protein YceK